MVDIDKIDSGGTDYGPEISALSEGKRDLSALQYTGLDLGDTNSHPGVAYKGIRNFVLSIPDYPDLSGELVLSAHQYSSDRWGNPFLAGNNMYMAYLSNG